MKNIIMRILLFSMMGFAISGCAVPAKSPKSPVQTVKPIPEEVTEYFTLLSGHVMPEIVTDKGSDVIVSYRKNKAFEESLDPEDLALIAVIPTKKGVSWGEKRFRMISNQIRFQIKKGYFSGEGPIQIYLAKKADRKQSLPSTASITQLRSEMFEFKKRVSNVLSVWVSYEK